MAHDVSESNPALADLGTTPDLAEGAGADRVGSPDIGLGTLERIWLKRAKRGPVDMALLEADRGLRGNANRGGRRQVTIISRERWSELMQALGATLPPSARRANLMVSGIELQQSRGRILRIGS